MADDDGIAIEVLLCCADARRAHVTQVYQRQASVAKSQQGCLRSSFKLRCSRHKGKVPVVGARGWDLKVEVQRLHATRLGVAS